MAPETNKTNTFRNRKRALLLWLTVTITAITIVFFIKSKQATYAVDGQTLAKGKNLFNAQCRSCHGIKEDGIGPRLGGVTLALSKETLLRFIQNPAKVIESGDERAKNLHKKYKKLCLHLIL